MTQRGQVRFLVRREILAAGDFTVAELVQRTGLNEASVRTELTRLKTRGLIESAPLRSGDAAGEKRRGAPTHRYRIVSDKDVLSSLRQSTSAFEPEERDHPPFDGQPPRVSVFGIGGAGLRALNQLRLDAVFPATLVAIETNARSISSSSADKKILLGNARTRGLGVGSDMELAQQIAKEERQSLREAIAGHDLVFVVAGLGDGTGAGIAPYLAGLAQEAGALTIGVVTEPFSFEGPQRQTMAAKSRANLLEHTDVLIPLPNDRLLLRADSAQSAQRALEVADRFMAEAVKSLTYLPLPAGLRCVSYRDLCQVLRDSGQAIVAMGRGAGSQRAQDAGQRLREGWLYWGDLDQTKDVLLTIAGPMDLRVAEIKEIVAGVRLLAPESATLLFADRLAPELYDEIHVTLTATRRAPDQWDPCVEDSMQQREMTAISTPAPAGDIDIPPFLR